MMNQRRRTRPKHRRARSPKKWLYLLMTGLLFLTIFIFNNLVTGPDSSLTASSQTTQHSESVDSKTSTQPLDARQATNFDYTVLPTTAKAKSIDKLLTQKNFTGTVLIVKNQQIIIQKGYGYANFEEKIKNDPQTMYQIGSIQKALTATLIMKQVAAGNLSLDDSLATYYPTIPDSQKITIRSLLTMTSGLRLPQEPTIALTERGLIQYILTHLKFQHYGVHSYQPVNFVLLAGILMQLTGLDYYQLFNQQISQPLNLKETLFFKEFYLNTKHSQSYRKQAEEDYTTPIPEKILSYTNELGTGNLGMSAGDLFRYFYALTQNKLFPAEIKNLLWGAGSKGEYSGGLYIYQHYFRTRGSISGFTGESYLTKDGRDGLILLSNRLPKEGNYEGLAKKIFHSLYTKPIT